jgi:hypothetical protein
MYPKAGFPPRGGVNRKGNSNRTANSFALAELECILPTNSPNLTAPPPRLIPSDDCIPAIEDLLALLD